MDTSGVTIETTITLNDGLAHIAQFAERVQVFLPAQLQEEKASAALL